MIAIIYYEKVTVVGVISIVLSLLSVSLKSLIFSRAITFKIFIFNWLSLVIDFLGIFCSLAFVFYNYDYNNRNNNGRIMTEWGEIWIWQSIIMWGIICVGFGLYAAPHILTEEWHDISRYHVARFVHQLIIKICKMTCRTVMWIFIFISVSVLAFLATNIGLFAPIALVCDTLTTCACFVLFRCFFFACQW